MSPEFNPSALAPPFDLLAEKGAWPEYAKALSRRGLSWFLDMDIPCLYLHLLPLGAESGLISQADRLSFLFDLVNPESPPDRFEAHYRFYKQEKEPEYRMAAAIAGVTAVWQSGREFERLEGWMACIDECLAEKGLSEQSRAAAEIVQGIVQCMAWGRLTAAIEKLQSALHWGDKAGSASQKVLAGAFLAYYRLINGDFTRGELALFDIAPLAELPQIPLYCKVHFICFRAIFHYLNRDIAQARDRLVEVVRNHYLKVYHMRSTMANYIAAIHKDAKSDFGVSFPDFPGCISAGKNLDETKDMAQDALALHIQGMWEDGEQLPPPSKLEDIMADPDYSDATAYLVVSVPEESPRPIRSLLRVKQTKLAGRFQIKGDRFSVEFSALNPWLAENGEQSGFMGPADQGKALW